MYASLAKVKLPRTRAVNVSTFSKSNLGCLQNPSVKHSLSINNNVRTNIIRSLATAKKSTVDATKKKASSSTKKASSQITENEPRKVVKQKPKSTPALDEDEDFSLKKQLGQKIRVAQKVEKAPRTSEVEDEDLPLEEEIEEEEEDDDEDFSVLTAQAMDDPQVDLLWSSLEKELLQQQAQKSQLREEKEKRIQERMESYQQTFQPYQRVQFSKPTKTYNSTLSRMDRLDRLEDKVAERVERQATERLVRQPDRERSEYRPYGQDRDRAEYKQDRPADRVSDYRADRVERSDYKQYFERSLGHKTQTNNEKPAEKTVDRSYTDIQTERENRPSDYRQYSVERISDRQTGRLDKTEKTDSAQSLAKTTGAVQGQIVPGAPSFLEQYQQQQQQYQQQVQANIQLMQNNQLLRQQIQLLQQLVNSFQQLLPTKPASVDETPKTKQPQTASVQNMWEQSTKLNAQVNELNKAQATAEQQAVTQPPTAPYTQPQPTPTRTAQPAATATPTRAAQPAATATAQQVGYQQGASYVRSSVQQEIPVQQQTQPQASVQQVQQTQYSRQQYVRQTQQQPSQQPQTQQPQQATRSPPTATSTEGNTTEPVVSTQAPSRTARPLSQHQEAAKPPATYQVPQQPTATQTTQARPTHPPQRVASQEPVRTAVQQPQQEAKPVSQQAQATVTAQEPRTPSPQPAAQARITTQQAPQARVQPTQVPQAASTSHSPSASQPQPPQKESPTQPIQQTQPQYADQGAKPKVSTPLSKLTQTSKHTGTQQQASVQQPQSRQIGYQRIQQAPSPQAPQPPQPPQTAPSQPPKEEQPTQTATSTAPKPKSPDEPDESAYSRQHLLTWAQKKSKEASKPASLSRQELDFIENSFQRVAKKAAPSIEIRPSQVAVAATVDIPSKPAATKTEATKQEVPPRAAPTPAEKPAPQAQTKSPQATPAKPVTPEEAAKPAKSESSKQTAKTDSKQKDQKEQTQQEPSQQKTQQRQKTLPQQKSPPPAVPLPLGTAPSAQTSAGKKPQKPKTIEFDKSSQEKLLSLVEGLHSPQPAQTDSENLQQVSSWLSNQLKDLRAKENEAANKSQPHNTILPSPGNPLRSGVSTSKTSFADTRKAAVSKLIHTLDEYEIHKDDPEDKPTPPVHHHSTEVEKASHGFLYRTHHHNPDYVEEHEPLELSTQANELKNALTRRGPLSGASVAVGATFKPNLENTGISMIPSALSPPCLAHGLEKVLYQPGIHWAKDMYDGSVWNSYLVKIHQPHMINYDVLPKFMQPSTDLTLNRLAVQNNCTVTASTSSITQLLTAFHLLYTGFDDLTDFIGTPPTSRRVPRAATYLVLRRQEGGVYSMDKPMSKSSNILTTLGRSLERMLTMEPAEFEKKMLKANNPEPLQDTEAYTFMKMDGLLVRSQLDCWDPNLPAPLQSFDLKTRATSAIRMDVENYERQSAYKLSKVTGPINSYEKEFRDLVHGRTLLKYYFQVKIGSMAGVFVAYHNTKEIFGFEFISVEEMEKIYFGDHQHAEFEFVSLLNVAKNVLSKITSSYPGQDLCILFGLNQHDMDIFVSPCEPGVADEVLITKPAHSWYKLSITPISKNLPYAIRRNPIGPEVEVKYELAKINQQFEEFKKDFEAMKSRTWQY